MSDLNFYENPEDAPIPQPRNQVRFVEAALKPYADGRRVKLNFKLTPFQERPSVEATITNAAGQPVATMSLIEAMDTNFDFTLHLRGPQPAGAHTLHLTLFYILNDEKPDEREIIDERQVAFEM